MKQILRINVIRFISVLMMAPVLSCGFCESPESQVNEKIAEQNKEVNDHFDGWSPQIPADAKANV
jgi:hypothetical protein